MRVRRRGALFALVVAALLVALTVYLSGGSTEILSETSSDGRERIEFVTPTRGQQLFVSGYDMPARARLRSVGSDAVLGTSGVFDLSGQGEVFWNTDAVQVGTSAVFDRKTRRWTIWQ